MQDFAHGVYTPVLTPFHHDGSVDAVAFAALIGRQFDKGVDGVVLFSNEAERCALSLDEQIGMLHVANNEINESRTPKRLIVGITTPEPNEALALAREARRVRANACMLFPFISQKERGPQDKKECADYQPAEFDIAREIRKNSACPLIYCHNPEYSGVSPGEDAIRRMGKTFDAVAISKNGFSEVNLFATAGMMVFLCDDPIVEKAYDFDEAQSRLLRPHLLGIMDAHANIFPELYVGIARTGFVSRVALECFELMEWLEEGLDRVVALKTLMGIPNVRRPLKRASREELSRVGKKFDRILELAPTHAGMLQESANGIAFCLREKLAIEELRVSSRSATPNQAEARGPSTGELRLRR